MIIAEYPFGATPLDPDEMEGLRIKSVSTRAELDRLEQANIEDAYFWLDKRRNKKEVLTQDFVCQLHEKMFGNVWSWAGKFRRSDKNIGVDWTKIALELRQLLDDANYWIEHNSYPPAGKNIGAFVFQQILAFVDNRYQSSIFRRRRKRHSQIIGIFIDAFIFFQLPKRYPIRLLRKRSQH
jgi:fido (protein-threonine AMPylation protein)